MNNDKPNGQDALLLLKLLAQAETDIQNKQLKPQADVFAELRATLKSADKKYHDKN
jgi:hypothetical protein